MDFKSIIFVMCIGIVLAQTEPSTDDLNKLPPDLQGRNYENQETSYKTLAAFKNKCEGNGGPEAYQKVEIAFDDFGRCQKAVVDFQELGQEVEEAKPHGLHQLEQVFKKFCQKMPQLKACFKNLTDTINSCFSVDEQINLKTFINVFEQLAEFVCFKEGEKIALFVSENGPTCIQEKRKEIGSCSNSTLETLTIHFIKINLGEEEFDQLQLGKLQKCVVSALEECSAPTTTNNAESMFKLAREALRNSASGLAVTSLTLSAVALALLV